MSIPICCVTGNIAGHPMACGDCDPCLAFNLVPEPVKKLIEENREWMNKYEDAMLRIDELQAFQQ